MVISRTGAAAVQGVAGSLSDKNSFETTIGLFWSCP